MTQQIDLHHFLFDHPGAKNRSAGSNYEIVKVRAGYRGEQWLGDPEHGHLVPEYERTVEVTVSPTGRSVRVWVDGVEVAARASLEANPGGES